MQPLGRTPKTHNFEDRHPGKGVKNWWEDIDSDRKRSERAASKRQINNEIKEASSD